MDPDLWFGHSLTNYDLNSAAATMLYAVSPVTSLDPISYSLNWFGGTDTIFLVPATNLYGAVLLVKSGGYRLVFAGGAPSPDGVQQAKDEWGYFSPFWGGNDALQGCSRVARSGAMRLMNPAGFPDFFAGATNIRMFGHSMGGNIIHAMKAILDSNLLRPQVGVVSYGAPKLGNMAFCRRFATSESNRYWLKEDVVPALPPRTDDAPAIILVVMGPIGFNRVDQWQHPQTCIQIGEPPGSWLPNNTIKLGTDAVYRNVIGEWLGGVNELTAAHSMFAYRSYFQSRVSLDTPEPVPVPVPAPFDSVTLRSRERAAQVRIGEAVMENDVQSPHSILRDWVVTPIAPGSTSRYQARLDGALWYVVRDGAVVDLGPGKRHAKLIARRLNKAAKIHH